MPRLLANPLKAPPAAEANPVKDAAIEAVIRKACEALIAATTELNELDGKVGDADCGSTMKLGAEMVLSVLPQVSTSNPKALFTGIGRNLDKLGGSSGVLLSIMFTTMAGVIGDDAKFTRDAIGPAFAEGVATIMNVGGAKPGMRTMVDVLQPVAEALISGSSGTQIADLAKAKAKATANIKSTNFGRSQYLNEESLAG